MATVRHIIGRYALVLAAGSLAACSDSSAGPKAEKGTRSPARIAEVSSVVGPTPSGFEIADSIAVRVTDSASNPLAGQLVTFSVVTGGGTVSPATKSTGSDGIARVAWTVGSPGPQLLRATAGSLKVEMPVNAVACRELALAVGDVEALNPEGAPCAILNGQGKRYFVSIVNATNSPLASVGYWARGLPAGALSNALQQTATAPVGSLGAPLFAASEERIHAAILEQNLELLNRYQPRSRATVHGANASAARAARPAVGDLIPIKVPDITTDPCNAFSPAVARVVYVGSRGIVLEDTTNVLKGQVDTLLVRVGREFDDVIFPILSANFGNPLAMDAQLNNDGALYMLVTDKVNKTGATGFVSSANFLPASQCPSSNMAEVFYARGLTPPGTSTGTLDFSFASTSRRLASVIIHESKHLTSAAVKLSQPGFSGSKPIEDAWLEESSAEIAMELLSRVTYSRPAKSNLDYAATLAKEARPASGLPLNMFHPFTYLYTYLAEPETHSLVGPADGNDFTFYGSGWSFLRWAIDTYGSSESAFLTAMNRDVSHWGIANIENLTGKPFSQLLGEFSIALALDDYPGFTPTDPKYSFPSWNIRSIFAGMNADFPNTFPLGAPLKVRSNAFGKFTVDVSGVRGGGFSMIELTGVQATRQLLELRGLGGSPFAPTMRVNIARLQ